MPRYQKKPTVADVARRRNQTVEQLIAEWGVTSTEALKERCRREGVEVPKDFALAPAAAFKPPRAPEPTETTGRKTRKSKVTLDDPSASLKRDGLGPEPTAGPSDPA